MYGIYCAVYALAHADDYDSAMRHIIGLRGDTDTNACIAGTLLGAVYGYDALCRSATFARNVEIMLACDTSESSSPRPEKYLFRSRLAQVEPLVACFAGSAE
jgi:hypothetical protein